MRSFSTGGVRVSRFVVWMFACVAGLVAPATSHAQQTYTWNQSATGQLWQTAANWTPNTGTPSAISDIAIFGNVLTSDNAVALSANVTIGELRFEDVNTNSTTTKYTIGSSSQSITFSNGTNPSLLTVSGWTLANQTVATNVEIGGTQPLTITNNGAPGVTTLTLTGAISATSSVPSLTVGGSSNTAISGLIGSSVGTLTKNGSGVLDLSGRTTSNTYTGGTVINGGTIKITNPSNDGGLTYITQLGTGNVTLNGGALHVAADTFVDNNFKIGASGGTIISTAGTGASNPTFRGVFSDLVAGAAGPLTVDGGFFVDFTANNTYTSATVVNNAGLRLLEGGRLSGTSSITVNGYLRGQIGILTLDNSSGLAGDRRVGNNSPVNTVPVTLNGGMIAGISGLLSNSNELLGNLTVRGYGSLNATQINGGAATGAMTFSNITRADNFSTLYVGGPVYGPAIAGVNYQINFTSGLSDSGAINTTIPVIPWIGGDRGKVSSDTFSLIPTNYASTLYAFNPTDGLVALDPNGPGFFQVPAGSSFNGAVPGAKNNAITNNPAAVNSSVTILSLVQNPASGVSTISGSGTLTVSSGAIANVNQMVFDGPTLNFGSNTGYLWLGNEFVVLGTSRITGTNGLVVSSNSDDGRNSLYLINTTNANTFSGGLYLNGTARVAFDTADTQLGAAGEKISFRGGTLRYIGNSAVTLSQGVTNRPLEMSAAGGGMISLEDSSGILTVPGLISGTEQLTVTGPGTLILTNSANTYAGGTTIGNSIVRITAPGSLGTGDITLGVKIGPTTFSGGTLRFDGAGTVAANVKHDFSSTINTNGNNVAISGVVSGNGAVLTKAGAGVLTLSAANTYTGSTTITGGTLMVTNTTGSGTGYGAVTVKTGATLGGTGAVAGPVSVESSGTLSVGATGGLGTLTLHGATTLASGSSFLTGLAGTTAGTQYGQLVVKPGGSLALGGATFVPTLSYSPANGDLLFIVDNQNASGGLSGTFNGLANEATYTFGDGTTAQISYFGKYGTLELTGGNDLVLYNFVPVPEPASVLAVAMLALAALAWSSRRKVAIAIVR